MTGGALKTIPQDVSRRIYLSPVPACRGGLKKEQCQTRLYPPGMQSDHVCDPLRCADFVPEIGVVVECKRLVAADCVGGNGVSAVCNRARFVDVVSRGGEADKKVRR